MAQPKAKPIVELDPVKVDPRHYKVDFENEHVRVLRSSYGPHEASALHGHPAGLAVFLTNTHFKFSFPDETTEERWGNAGQTSWVAAEVHVAENVSDTPAEIVLIELKDYWWVSHPNRQHLGADRVKADRSRPGGPDRTMGS